MGAGRQTSRNRVPWAHLLEARQRPAVQSEKQSGIDLPQNDVTRSDARRETRAQGLGAGLLAGEASGESQAAVYVRGTSVAFFSPEQLFNPCLAEPLDGSADARDATQIDPDSQDHGTVTRACGWRG